MILNVLSAMSNRHSIRLPEYDYSQPGSYFITINIKDRRPILGSINEGYLLLSDYGKIVNQAWLDLVQVYPNLGLDVFVVMPDHFHGIVTIEYTEMPTTTEQNSPQNRRKMLIPKIVGRFKMNSAKRINECRQTRGCAVWQRNYFERVIRTEQELSATRVYKQQSASL